MYRIELSPGEETAFRSIEELAVAIRRKVVTPRARIYHSASNKWLPIQFHPHYKIAASMPLTQADLVAGPPVAPLSSLSLGQSRPQNPPATGAAANLPAPPISRESSVQAALAAWPQMKPMTELSRQVPIAPPPPASIARPEPPKVVAPKAVAPRAEPRRVAAPKPEPARAVAPKVEATATPAKKRTSRSRKSRRSLRVALAGALLLVCGHLAMSAGLSQSDEARPHAHRRLIATPAVATRTESPKKISAPATATLAPGLSESLAKASKTLKRSAGWKPPAPAPTAAPKPAASDSVVRDSIAPAPSAIEIVAPAVQGPQAFTPKISDSSGKSITRILRAISGSPPPGNIQPKR